MERVKSKYGCSVIVDLALPGAGSLLTILQHPVCMWDMTSAYPKEVTEFVPCVCPVQPEPGKAFCSEHSKASESLQRPSQLHAFLRSCGVRGEGQTKEQKKTVDSILKEMADLCKQRLMVSVGDEQGTEQLMRNETLMSADNLKVEDDE